MKKHHPIPVAIGIIYNSRGKILISQRPEGSVQPGLWEFPGGKMEPGESALAALKRELKEELGIIVTKAQWLLTLPYDYEHYSVILHVYKVLNFTGEASGQESQKIQWVAKTDLNQFTFPKANSEIMIALSD